MRVHIVREAVFGGFYYVRRPVAIYLQFTAAPSVSIRTPYTHAPPRRVCSLSHHSFRSKQWRVHLVSIRASVDANMGYPGSRDLEEGAALSKDEVRKEIQEFRMGNHP